MKSIYSCTNCAYEQEESVDAKYIEARTCEACGSTMTHAFVIQEKNPVPKFLTIELDTIDSVPKVFYKGEEIKDMLKRVDFTWITKGDEVAFFESPHINIEHMEKDKDGKYHFKRIGWNEREESKQPENIINWFVNEIANHNAKMKEMDEQFKEFSAEGEKRRKEMRERFEQRKMRNNKVFQDVRRNHNEQR